jgi:hypothetical protein
MTTISLYHTMKTPQCSLNFNRFEVLEGLDY